MLRVQLLCLHERDLILYWPRDKAQSANAIVNITHFCDVIVRNDKAL